MTALTENAKKFLAQAPTLIGQIAGCKFYEHPVYGDESPMVAIFNGKKWTSPFYDLPSLGETIDWLEEKTNGNRHRYFEGTE